MKLYKFRQNNSGGSFEQNDDVDINVFVEAIAAEEANRRAEDIGIYFNGCDKGWDCNCCGDRWNSIWEDDNEYNVVDTGDSDSVEELEMRVRESLDHGYGSHTEPAIIHYLNGTKRKIESEARR